MTSTISDVEPPDLVPVPPLGPPPAMTPPLMADHTAPNRLRILAVRRPGAPLVEVRLRVPFGSTKPSHAARRRLLADTFLAGTPAKDRTQLAEQVQALGATLTVATDADQLLIGGVVLAPCLDTLLELLVECLVGASYPDNEVAVERERLVQRLDVARSRASVRAKETLHEHLYGNHPYSRDLPQPTEVKATTAADIRALHRERVIPDGSVLVLVGDLDPEPAVSRAGVILAGWSSSVVSPTDQPPDRVPELPTVAPADPSLLFHREGSVQSTIRIGGPAVRREDPRYPALQLANLIYGGYFSSRLVANIREDKGYTYTPRSRIEHAKSGSTLVVEADVATNVTAPALLEIWYELGRLSTLRPTDQELDDVRQYAAGTLAMSIGTQDGLASTLCTLAGVGLDLSWIYRHPERLANVTAEDIYEMGVHLLAPRRLAVVVIGDATRCAEPLQAFGPWCVVH